MRIYLDNCCFNRPFDDQSQLRIKLETEAKLKIQEEIRMGNIELAWSYILDYENAKNPFEERKIRIAGWKKYAGIDIDESVGVLEKAKIASEHGLKKLDSLHIACAIVANSEYFITTDDKVLKRSNIIEEIKLTDTIGFIKEVLS